MTLTLLNCKSSTLFCCLGRKLVEGMSAKPAEGKQDRVAEACGASGKENMTTDVTASGGSLAKMFLEGASLIESKK